MNVVEANGARIPAIGLGTMTLKEQVCIDAIKAALRLGYRHLDTAERYGNEEWVGEGLRQGLAASGLKREDVFVTTKVYWDKLAPGDFEGSIEGSLGRLKPRAGGLPRRRRRGRETRLGPRASAREQAGDGEREHARHR